MDFMAVYGEAGMIGVVGAMFVYLVVSLSNKSAKQQETLESLKIENKGQSETLENMEGMIIKLIARWNQSDDKLDRKFDALTKEINDLDNQISEVKGSLSRINGRH
jgi:predicted RNase H-like nuclease (RuvC/YqgF family)|tara:strand:+ start:987 stop:1304 length:318 start_codon:yes stop_codon:yes gene_type:complete